MNNEILEKAKAAKSPEELLKIAHEIGMSEFNEENAKVYFNAINNRGELADEELDVSAGGCAVRAHGQKMVSALNSCSHWKCKYCNVYNGTNLKKKDRYLDEECLVDCVGACLPKPDIPLYSFTARDHDCCECYYCSYERGAWWCNNKPHYNE